MGNAARISEYSFEPHFTNHAESRLSSRGVNREDIAIVMTYGRSYYVRGAVVYALGHQEEKVCRKDGIKVDRVMGLQVVCAPDDDTVITVYRNHDFSTLRRRNTRWSPRY